jgi:hypothetical protein
VDYHLVGSSRYQEYFPQDQSIEFSLPGLPRTISIPNSARPAAPQVEYVLPTFGWTTPTQGNIGTLPPLGPATQPKEVTFTRVRLGGGLRVYFKRPWYSSGDGELLGVILAQPPQKVINILDIFKNPPWKLGQKTFPAAPTSQLIDYFLPYVTQCGLDPTWKSDLPKTALTHEDFSNCVTHKEDLTLEELGQIPSSKPHLVNVACFAPVYDNERKLWRCDIQFNPARLTSYFPFVRLALARFQPDSIADAHLSRVVMSEFVQLVPTRELQVTILADQKSINLTLTGTAPNTGIGDTVETANTVRVTVEVHDGTLPGDLGWKAVDSQPVTLAVNPGSGSSEWVWNGAVVLPTIRSSGHYRLVVKETETFVSDGPIDKSSQGITDIDAERVVYADVVEL